MDIEDDEPTRIVRRSTPPKDPKNPIEDDEQTRKVQHSTPTNAPATPVEDDEQTLIVRAKGATPEQPSPATATPPVAQLAVAQPVAAPVQMGQSAAPAPDHQDAPVVGWLVILEGLGKGHYRDLGNGVNHIGRGQGMRVCLDFGDMEISEACQAEIIYNPKAREFSIRKGHETRNLTYLGEHDKLVTGDTPLEAGEVITMGSTKLRFVPFCSPDFGWSDEA